MLLLVFAGREPRLALYTSLLLPFEQNFRGLLPLAEVLSVCRSLLRELTKVDEAVTQAEVDGNRVIMASC
jgi:hypothetical protein